jgi:cobalt/nickel transport system permease protein
MHIPDGFLSTPVWLALDAAAAPAVGYLVRRAQRQSDDHRLPLLGVMGAFVFAAQMINFPVGVGTSGHLVGGTLLAVTLGPAAAAVVMTAILAVQALVFQDGGLLALGANVVNMALVGVAAGYLPYHFWGSGRLRKPAIVAGGLLSVLAGAALAIAELVASGVRLPGAVLSISVGLFALTGLIEGAITLAVVQGIEKLNPAFVRRPAPRRSALGAIAAASVALAVVGVLFASAAPDGLEALAAQAGIADKALLLFDTPFAEYEARFFGSEWIRKASAGLLGLGVIYGVCLVVGRAFSRQRSA